MAHSIRRGKDLNWAQLLTNESVQDELELTDDQMKAIANAQEAWKEARAKTHKTAKTYKIGGIEMTDRHVRRLYKDLMTQVDQDYRSALMKVKADLTAKQSERLTQIEFQNATKLDSPRIWANDDVQKGFRFSGKQTDTVKTTLANLQVEIEGQMGWLVAMERDQANAEHWTNPSHWANLMKNVSPQTKTVDEMDKEANDKITGTFDDDQKGLLKTFGGEPFQLKHYDPIEQFVHESGS